MARLVIAVIIALFAIITYFSSTSENPLTGEKQRVAMTPEQEIALGYQSAPQMAAQMGGISRNAQAVALYRALRQGATGRKRTFDRLPEHFLIGNYDPPAFTVRLAHKDMSLAIELAKEAGVPMRVGDIALDELDEAVKRGWSERDCRVAMTLQEERARVSVAVPRERLENLPD